jgi:hypothetical protein
MAIVNLAPAYFCDICGKEFDKNELHVDEYKVSRIAMIKYEIWYQGYIKTDCICQKCSKSIVAYINSLAVEHRIDFHKWTKL